MDNFFPVFHSYFIDISLILNLLYNLHRRKKSIVLSSRIQYFENFLNLQIRKPHPTEEMRHFLLHLEYSSDCQNFSVICLRNLDTCLFIGSMDNLSVSDIESHMTGIANQITGLCIFQTVHGITLSPVSR